MAKGEITIIRRFTIYKGTENEREVIITTVSVDNLRATRSAAWDYALEHPKSELALSDAKQIDHLIASIIDQHGTTDEEVWRLMGKFDSAYREPISEDIDENGL